MNEVRWPVTIVALLAILGLLGTMAWMRPESLPATEMNAIAVPTDGADSSDGLCTSDSVASPSRPVCAYPYGSTWPASGSTENAPSTTGEAR